MLRGFRHTLFLLLQVGVVISAGLALLVEPSAWRAIAVCALGALVASLVCERIARRYLGRTLGRLRRVADDIGHGRPAAAIEVQPGDDFYKLINAVNLMATRLAEASREERRLHEELRRRERLAILGELAATVAHEVNNPLDGVQNCTRILRRSLGDAQRAEHMLDLIDDGLDRIDLIVRRLLTLAREHVIRPLEARVSDVIESAWMAIAEKAEAQGVRLKRAFETVDDWASVDSQLLEQVFVNLFVNAADSMPDGGELRVLIQRESGVGGDTLRVDVSDSGAGIAPEVLPHIFEPFYSTKAGGRGTGLGLPIAARIIDAHRGSIQVAPREDGGTNFALRIPALPSRATERGAPRPAAVRIE